MPSAWSGTIEELRTLVESRKYVDVISAGFTSVYQSPSIKEIRSWEHSIPVVTGALKDNKFAKLKVILELGMPVGAERADLILLGGTKQHPKAVVCELKQWSGFDILESTLEVEVPGIGYKLHPSLQALNYRGKLMFFSERGSQNELKACVIAHNASAKEKKILETGIASDWAMAAPIFSSEGLNHFQNFVDEFLLPPEFECNEAELLDLSPYKQSNKLFEHLEKHGKEIANNIAVALANSGMGLTEEQAEIENEVIRALLNGQSKHLIVQGGPGSGKSLLAVSLLLRAASLKYETIYALRNNRLQAILKKVLDENYPGLSGLTFYFNPRQGKSLKNHPGKLDLLICDEAQRMDMPPLQVTPEKARVSVIFLDETQRFNPTEQGTIRNFAQTYEDHKKPYELKELSAAIRCSGGKPYHEWVNQLLQDPSSMKSLEIFQKIWGQKYEFQTFKTITELVNKLRSKVSEETRVALVASFTESPGIPNNPSHPDNLRIGYPLTSGFSGYKGLAINIPWLMSTREYERFWKEGKSNNLDRIASIYGAQGFETDYIGLIWGRDLLFRDGRWKLGDPNHCYDSIEQLITKSKSGHKWNGEALPLVINRYRVFLTRGIRGTFVFCEDEETRNYFTALGEESDGKYK